MADSIKRELTSCESSAMRIHKIFLPFLLLICFTECGAEELKCDIRSSATITTLDELPGQVQDLIGRSRIGSAGIANIGEDFNPGCVVLSPPLPMRRLVNGNIGQQCIRLVIEYGGVGHHQRTLEFQQYQTGWQQVSGTALDQLPKPPPALLIDR